MPANLTPQYHKAEQAYRAATTTQEEIECLQLMLKEVPKHKGTDKLQAELKQKISRLKKEASQTISTGRRAGFRLPKQGAGRAVIIGPPNSGKSHLLASLTRAQPEIADYPFTTREPKPGMMPWEDVFVQLIDTPPVTAEIYASEVQALVRSADVVLFVADLGVDEGGKDLAASITRIQASRTRLSLTSWLDENDVGISYTAAMIIFNKIDLPEAPDRRQFFEEYIDVDWPRFLVSAKTGMGLDEFKRKIYEKLDVVRVYTKLPNRKEADMQRPYTLTRGGTVADLAQLIHNDLAQRFRTARVWGSNVHDATIVREDYVLNDLDIVEIHT